MHSTVALTIPGPSSLPLYVETYGKPAQPQTVLLLHGGLQSLRCFHHQFAAFSQQHYVIAMDLPYHGRSLPVPSSVSINPALWADSVRAVLAHLDRLERPCVILAWSFGGLVTRHYLQTYGQESINGLILVGSLLGGIPAYQAVQTPAAAQITYMMMGQQISLAARVRAFEHFVGMLTKKPLSPLERDAQYGYNARAFLHSFSATDHWLDEIPCEVPEFLGHLQMPVLMIQGLDDALVSPVYTQQVASMLREAQVLCYEDCGHAPFLEYPERFNQDVLAFLAARSIDRKSRQAA